MRFSLLRTLFHLTIIGTLFEGEGGGAFMGGSGGGGGDIPPANQPPEGGGIQYQYPEGLDQSYHGNPTLLKYANDDGSFNQANIMKSLIHATSQMGADKMIKPNDKFTDEQWRETFHNLGLPKELSEYSIENNLSEGQQANEEMFNKFKELAHQQGILPKQAQAIVDFFNASSNEQIANFDKINQERIEADTKKLRSEWGDAFDQNIQMAESALNHLIPDENERKEIIDSGLLDFGSVTKLFHRLGKGLQEDGFDHQVTGTFNQTPAQLQDSIKSIHAELTTMGKGHPNYQAKLKEYQDTLNRLHGTKPVAPSR